ncbi:MAG: bacillithiol system redox-active protein YtxJ [Cytophagales bacterium]
MEWNNLTDELQLEELKKKSEIQPVLIFKHSTTCSISIAAKARLERNWKKEQAENVSTFYLDLLSHRNISNKIATEFGVKHESPQVLLLKNGKVVFHTSHLNINFDAIVKNS